MIHAAPSSNKPQYYCISIAINFHLINMQFEFTYNKSFNMYKHVCLSVCLSVYLSVCLSVCLSVFMYVCLCEFIWLLMMSVCMFVFRESSWNINGNLKSLIPHNCKFWHAMLGVSIETHSPIGELVNCRSVSVSHITSSYWHQLKNSVSVGWK